MGTAADLVLDAGRVQRARVLTLIWLATTVFTSVVMPGIGVLREPRPLWAVIGSIGILFFAIMQSGVLYDAVTPGQTGRRWRIGFVLASVLSVVLVAPVAAGLWPTWAWVGAGIVGTLPLLLRPWRAAAFGALVCITAMAVAVATGGSPAQSIIITGLIGGAIAVLNAGPVWLWRIVADARSGREAVAALAVSEERLRFAREVHDVVGHALTVIALKAELLERSGEPAHLDVRQQAGEIRRLATSALDDVRAAVVDTRRVAFIDEVDALRAVLIASGIRGEVRIDARVPAAHATMFGRIAREAVTNVLRHSRAGWCEISTAQVGDELVLIVRNNGVVGRGAGDTTGSGLSGARERLREYGGRLAVTRQGDEFELRASIKVAS